MQRICIKLRFFEITFSKTNTTKEAAKWERKTICETNKTCMQKKGLWEKSLANDDFGRDRRMKRIRCNSNNTIQEWL